MPKSWKNATPRRPPTAPTPWTSDGDPELHAEGNNLFPVWDNPSIASDQRRGEDKATYTVYFVSADDNYTYNPGTLDEYKQYDIGSDWSLSLNALGGIVSVEPAR
jgi:hypothetical protein